jgi:hypothetical protein
MSAALTESTPVKSTVSRTVAIMASSLTFAATVAWYAAIQYAELNRRLASIEEFMRHEVVTQSQAERYAAIFRWENRSLQIMVPEPSNYRDKPKS